MKKSLRLDKIQRFAKKYFAEHHKPALGFHNYKRAKNVVKAAKKIANQYDLSKEEYFVVIAAAWFHSTGYLISNSDPQSAGADLAVKFFNTRKIDHIDLDKICTVIMAPLQTDYTEDILIRILLDAIFYYLGTKSFLKKLELQRKEQEWVSGRHIDKTDWLSASYECVVDYKFHTIFALEKLKSGVDKNLKKLREELIERLIIDEDNLVVIKNPSGQS